MKKLSMIVVLAIVFCLTGNAGASSESKNMKNARAYITLEKYEEAERALMKEMEDNAGNTEAYYLMGTIAFFEEKNKYFDFAIKLDKTLNKRVSLYYLDRLRTKKYNYSMFNRSNDKWPRKCAESAIKYDPSCRDDVYNALIAFIINTDKRSFIGFSFNLTQMELAKELFPEKRKEINELCFSLAKKAINDEHYFKANLYFCESEMNGADIATLCLNYITPSSSDRDELRFLSLAAKFDNKYEARRAEKLKTFMESLPPKETQISLPGYPKTVIGKGFDEDSYILIGVYGKDLLVGDGLLIEGKGFLSCNGDLDSSKSTLRSGGTVTRTKGQCRIYSEVGVPILIDLKRTVPSLAQK